MTDLPTEEAWAATFRSRDVNEIRMRLAAYPALVPLLMIEGVPALYWATLQGNETAVEQLLAHGAPATASEGHHQPLIAAVRRGFLRIALRLLAAGASADIRDHNGDTALHAVSTCDSAALGVGLYSERLEHGADAALRDANGRTSLAHATRYLPEEISRALRASSAGIPPGRAPRR